MLREARFAGLPRTTGASVLGSKKATFGWLSCVMTDKNGN